MLLIQGVKAEVGMKVYDLWWPWQMGRITRVLKTRIKVAMSSTGEIETYDRAHLQFLRIG